MRKGWGKGQPYGSACVCGRGEVVGSRGCLMCALDWNDAALDAEAHEKARRRHQERLEERLIEAEERWGPWLGRALMEGGWRR